MTRPGSRTLLALLPIALAGLLAAPAANAESFTGETTRGYSVRLTTDEGSGTPEKFVIGWKTNRCERRGNTFSSTPRYPGFDSANPDALADKGVYKVKQRRDGLVSTVRVKLRGERVSARRWEGRFSAKVRVERNGKPYDRCVQRPVGWVAKVKPGGGAMTRPPAPGLRG